MTTDPDGDRRPALAAGATWLLVALLAVVSLVGAGVALVLPLSCGSATTCDTGRVETGSAVGLTPVALTLVVASLVRSRHRTGRSARTVPLVGLAAAAVLLVVAVVLLESGIEG